MSTESGSTILPPLGADDSSALAHTAKSVTHPPHHLGFIDSLRGLAALYVVCYHLVFVPHPNLIMPHWASGFIGMGGNGVTLFFIVSAFTLSLSMHARRDEPHPVQRFYLRRIFRIVPLYYFWMVLSLLRDHTLLHQTHRPKEILLDLFFGYNFFPGAIQGIVWASWILGVEMVFYLLFPLLFHFINNVWKAAAFAVGALLLSAGFHDLVLRSAIAADEKFRFYHLSLAHNLPAFALGILAFFIYERWIHGQSRSHKAAAFLIGGAAILYYLQMTGHLNFLLEGWHWQAVIYTTLLLGLAITPFRAIVNHLTRFLGKISYSLYLNHPTIVLLLTPLYMAIYKLPAPLTIRFGLCLLATLAILTPFSYATYRLIEEPGIRWGSRVIKRKAAA